jgi:hypothetical protein
LIGESGGRLDRRDALLLLLVFASTLLLRSYRLEVPYSMHFDEVYHARTATEFLQDWRYGMPHSIYEYTHPHLAKYAMALGIEALGNNQVIGTQELGTTVKAAVTEKRWNPSGSLARNGESCTYGHGRRCARLRTYRRVNRSSSSTAHSI